MSPYRNSKKEKFLSGLPRIILDSSTCDIALRCKFNFSYFDNSQNPGQKLSAWDEDNLQKLMVKLQEFTRNSLTHWKQERIGSRKNHVLEIYGDFPLRSEFYHPKHVPADVHWGRFRIDSAARLVGFVIPEALEGCSSRNNKQLFDCNTFYIVFLDTEHKFYKVTK